MLRSHIRAHSPFIRPNFPNIDSYSGRTARLWTWIYPTALPKTITEIIRSCAGDHIPVEHDIAKAAKRMSLPQITRRGNRCRRGIWQYCKASSSPWAISMLRSHIRAHSPFIRSDNPNIDSYSGRTARLWTWIDPTALPKTIAEIIRIRVRDRIPREHDITRTATRGILPQITRRGNRCRRGIWQYCKASSSPWAISMLRSHIRAHSPFIRSDNPNIDSYSGRTARLWTWIDPTALLKTITEIIRIRVRDRIPSEYDITRTARRGSLPQITRCGNRCRWGIWQYRKGG